MPVGPPVCHVALLQQWPVPQHEQTQQQGYTLPLVHLLLLGLLSKIEPAAGPTAEHSQLQQLSHPLGSYACLHGCVRFL